MSSARLLSILQGIRDKSGDITQFKGGLWLILDILGPFSRIFLRDMVNLINFIERVYDYTLYQEHFVKISCENIKNLAIGSKSATTPPKKR